MVDVAAYFWNDGRAPELIGRNKLTPSLYDWWSGSGRWGPSDRRWRDEALAQVPPLVAMVYATIQTKGDAKVAGDPEAVEDLAYWCAVVEHEFAVRNGRAEDAADEVALLEHARQEFDGRPAGSKRAGTRATVRYEAKQLKQTEDALLGRYATWLGDESIGSKTVTQGIRSIEVDGVDLERQRIIEAKGDASAAFVRMAIGQVLDYQRLWKVVAPPVILLPRLPDPDLVELVCSLGITLAYEVSDHVFAEREATGNLPAAASKGTAPLA